MILEDERGLNLPCFYDNVSTRVQPERNPDHVDAFLEVHRAIESEHTHHQLQNDLAEHLWARQGMATTAAAGQQIRIMWNNLLLFLIIVKLYFMR